MENQFSRTELLIGKENVEKLKKAKIAIFGIGGVGSYVLEGLARAGIGNFLLIDNDKISVSNLNRQIIATQSTIGKSKVEAFKERISSFSDTLVIPIQEKYDPILFDTYKPDYVIDACDDIQKQK